MCFLSVSCSELYVQISSLLLNSTEFKVPSSLSSDRLADLSHFLPLLGVPFLQGLTPSQLLAAFPALNSVSFSPAQVEERTQPVMYSEDIGCILYNSISVAI